MKISKDKLKKIIKEELAVELGEASGHGSAYHMFEVLKNALGPEGLLDELFQAMSEQEAIENFEHIAQMHDIDLDEEM